MKKVKRYSAGGYEESDDAKNLESAAAREKAEYEGRGRDVLDETGSKSRLKRNLETGELYDPVGTKTEKAKGKKSARGSTDMEQFLTGSKAKTGSYAEAAKSSRTLGDVIRSISRSAPDFSSTKASPEDVRKIFNKDRANYNPRRGGSYKAGGTVGSASKRADGCAQRGKTRGKMV